MHWHFVVDPVPTKNKLPRDLLPAVWHFRRKLIIVVCVHACMHARVHEWVSEWVSQWVTEWATEWASMSCLFVNFVRACVHVCVHAVYGGGGWVPPRKQRLCYDIREGRKSARNYSLQQLGLSWNSVMKAWCSSKLFCQLFQCNIRSIKTV